MARIVMVRAMTSAEGNVLSQYALDGKLMFQQSARTARTSGNVIRSEETEELRSPNNRMRSGVEWRRVQGRLDAKRQEERRKLGFEE